jgi:transcriptional antiterminator
MPLFPSIAIIPNTLKMKKEPSKAKTREQIAEEYGISSRTLSRLLKNNNISLPRSLIYPKDQLRIYKTFGDPIEHV